MGSVLGAAFFFVNIPNLKNKKKDTNVEHQNESTEYPGLCIKLLQPIHHVPSDVSLLLPREKTLSLIRQRQAIPVGNWHLAADIEISEEDVPLAFGEVPQ